MIKRRKLVFIVTAPVTAKAFLAGQLRYLQQGGFDLLVISSPGPELEELARQDQVRIEAVSMTRSLSPLADLRSLLHLMMVLWRVRPDIVNASTPKAGLLGMIAAYLTCVPVRIYQQRGLRLETKTGSLRHLLTWTERIACACATQVVCNSKSLRQRLIELRLAPPHKLVVLRYQSSNGIRTQRFLPTPTAQEGAAQLRATLGIAPDEKVVGFFGRLTPDKGFVDLMDCLDLLRQQHPKLRLLILGKPETEDPISAVTLHQLHHHPAIVYAGYASDTAPYYLLLDLLVLPSYREGFPNVPLEAALACVPTVGYRATGTVDAIVHEQTGWLVEAGNRRDLAAAISLLLASDELRQHLGRQAQEFVLQEFKAENIWECWQEFYLAASADRQHQR